MPDIVEMAYLDALIANAVAEMENIQLARDFFRGIQGAEPSDRQKEYLQVGDDIEFRFNVCHTVVNALSNELKLLGFATSEEGEQKEQAAWISQLYKDADLDTLQSDVHEGAFADSETFVIIEYDLAKKRPTLTAS